MKLINAKQMIKNAFDNGYAIPHINTNNLEWTKAILEAAQEMNSPIIIATSEGAVKYMGGFKLVGHLVQDLIESLKITIPVALHLDHGSYEGAKEVLENDYGYTSVMFDGSHLSFEDNFKKSQELIELANKKDMSFEIEVGTIGGEEDGIVGSGEMADPKEVEQMAGLNPDMIACGIGNIHGPYPENWKGLNFDLLKTLKSAANRCIVLHGGSGIDSEQIKKSISLGVSKINVNTELQQANAKAIKEFVVSGKIDEGKNFDPRKLLKQGYLAMVETVKEKIILFGSNNKA